MGSHSIHTNTWVPQLPQLHPESLSSWKTGMACPTTISSHQLQHWGHSAIAANEGWPNLFLTVACCNLGIFFRPTLGSYESCHDESTMLIDDKQENGVYRLLCLACLYWNVQAMGPISTLGPIHFHPKNTHLTSVDPDHTHWKGQPYQNSNWLDVDNFSIE